MAALRALDLLSRIHPDRICGLGIKESRGPKGRNVIAPTVRSGSTLLGVFFGGPKDRTDHAGPSGLIMLVGIPNPDLTVGAITTQRFAPFLTGDSTPLTHGN
jgi:nitrous oxide reductase accessory protein NosL